MNAITSTVVHRHATVSDRAYCDTVCGERCDEVPTAYAHDAERVTCQACLNR